MTKVVKMTNREILENATKRLDKAGIAEAGNDAWLLFSEAFGLSLIHISEPTRPY